MWGSVIIDQKMFCPESTQGSTVTLEQQISVQAEDGQKFRCLEKGEDLTHFWLRSTFLARRQVDDCKLEGSLVYIVGSRPAWVT